MVFPTSFGAFSRPGSMEGAPGPAEVPGVFAGHQQCRPASEVMNLGYEIILYYIISYYIIYNLYNHLPYSAIYYLVGGDWNMMEHD